MIASNDDGYLPGNRRNFVIRENLAAGVYYVKSVLSTKGPMGRPMGRIRCTPRPSPSRAAPSPTLSH